MEIVNFIPQTTIINIDIYFMIVIGQITIYGIMLAFYQFVVTLYGNKESGLRYLNRNLSDYYVNQKVPLLKVVKNLLFIVLTIAEIIYVPFVSIAGHFLPENVRHIADLAWYAWIIIYFCIFFIMFWKCANAMIRIRLGAYDKDELIKKINKKFVKNRKRKKANNRKKPVDVLDENLEIIMRAIASDGYSSKQPYLDLTFELIGEYIQSKNTEICKMENGEETPENQEGWLYNESVERDIIHDIIGGTNDIKDEKLEKSIVMRLFISYKDLLELNSRRARLAGYEIISCEYSKCTISKHASTAVKIFYTEPFVRNWKRILLAIYDRAGKDLRIKIVEDIYRLEIEYPEWIYFKEFLINLLRNEMDAVFEEKESQKDSWEIFGAVVVSDTYKSHFSNMLADKLVEYFKFDAGDIIKTIDATTCTYIFFYIVIHYSIYRGQKNWRYINLNVLNLLWDRHFDLHECQDEIINGIKESNTGHRFYEEMYQCFVDYIEERNEFRALQKAKDDNVMGLFYVWLARRIAIGHRVYFLSDEEDYDSKENLNNITLIINELAGHEELLESDQIKDWIEQMRYGFFSNLQSVPEKLDISLESLLLTDVNGKCVASYIQDHKYCRSDVGTYLLIKNGDLFKAQHRNRDIINLICRAFVEKNCDLETYVKMITEKCKQFGVTLDYIQVEQIKNYLHSIIIDCYQQKK